MSQGYTIKRSPEDFIVEEVSDVTYEQQGPYTVVDVRKEGLNTEAAKRILADAFHLNPDDVAYAGLKDKRAQTTQLFSLRGVSAGAIERFTHPQLSLTLRGFLARALYVGAHGGNRFTIRATIETLGARVAYDNGKSHLAATPILINYFDEQRFSEHNVDIGLAILKKDFAAAAKLAGEHTGRDGEGLRLFLERNPTNPVGALGRLPPDILVLFIHAVQSRVWNNALSAYVTKHAQGAVHEVGYSQGVLRFPEDPGFLQGILFPMPGFGRASDERFDTLIDAQMQALGITDRDFVIRQLPKATSEGGMRQAAVPIAGFVAREESETSIVVSFELPKGSYATMVLKQLFRQ